MHRSCLPPGLPSRRVRRLQELGSTRCRRLFRTRAVQRILRPPPPAPPQAQRPARPARRGLRHQERREAGLPLPSCAACWTQNSGHIAHTGVGDCVRNPGRRDFADQGLDVAAQGPITPASFQSLSDSVLPSIRELVEDACQDPYRDALRQGSEQNLLGGGFGGFTRRRSDRTPPRTSGRPRRHRGHGAWRSNCSNA